MNEMSRLAHKGKIDKSDIMMEIDLENQSEMS